MKRTGFRLFSQRAWLSLVLIIVIHSPIHAEPVHAKPAEGVIKSLIDGPLGELANSLAVVSSLRAQNTMHQSLTDQQIQELDTRWRAGDTSLITPVLTNDLSTYLIAYAQKSDGLYGEIFVIDRKGLNVGQSAVTSDYWQGDEEIFIHAFADEQHVSPPTYDESTAMEEIKVALPVKDETGAILGVLAVGINAAKIATLQ